MIMLSMKKIVCKALVVVTLLCYGSIGVAEAHPGRTDANGGHTCRTNCASWGLSQGEYHYHGGGGSSAGGSTGESYAAPESRSEAEAVRRSAAGGCSAPTGVFDHGQRCLTPLLARGSRRFSNGAPPAPVERGGPTVVVFEAAPTWPASIPIQRPHRRTPQDWSTSFHPR